VSAADDDLGDDDPRADDLHHAAAYFRRIYAVDHDPWGFDRRWYERRKFALTLAALTRRRYRHAYEPGCANGSLTELLATRCDRVDATELVAEVAARARERVGELAHVVVHRAAFPAWWPDAPIDLLVLSEVAYYLREPGRAVVAERLRASLVVGGEVLAVHYTGATDYPMRGCDVAAWLDGIDVLDRVVVHLDDGFELAVWRRRQ
jgi:trans-aconitate methyltransferase